MTAIVVESIAADLATGDVLLPPGRAGRLCGVSAAAVVRWARRGRRGVRLDAVRGQTTAAAVRRFLRATEGRP